MGDTSATGVEKEKVVITGIEHHYWHQWCWADIALGIPCDKVPMAKMITVKDLIIISHSYRVFLQTKSRYLQRPLKQQ